MVSESCDEGAGGGLRLPAAGGRLDLLGQRPARGRKLAWVREGLLGCGKRPLIAAKTVVEHRGRVPTGADPPPLAPAGGVPIAGLDQPQSLHFAAAPTGEEQTADRHVRISDRDANLSRLFSERLRGGELASMHVTPGPMVESEREDRERTRITGELHITVRQHAPALLVPQMYGRDAGQPEPTQGLIVREVVAAEGAKRALQHRRRSPGTLGDQQRLAIQEEIGRALRSRTGARPFRRARRLRHLQHTVGLRETPRVHRRGQRLGVGFARERGIKRLEALGGLQQQRCSVAAAVQRERDLTAQQLHLGALETRSAVRLLRWQSVGAPRRTRRLGAWSVPRRALASSCARARV